MKLKLKQFQNCKLKILNKIGKQIKHQNCNQKHFNKNFKII